MDMIEKICEVIDGEYVCDIDISVEEWKILKKFLMTKVLQR